MALQLTLAAWAVFEVGLRVGERVQGRGGTASDRATRVFIAVAIGVAVALAVATESHVRAAGLVVTWLGLAIRIWAVASLGRAFRTTVEVDPGQDVVTTGPYRWVRHPSYTGLLLIVAGFGIAAGTWPAAIVSIALPLPAVLWRIHVEEAELTRVLGTHYRTYQQHTSRLIPGVW
jgi:protein-S-isoprenylcysteine O-methyltransferase Ste14